MAKALFFESLYPEIFINELEKLREIVVVVENGTGFNKYDHIYEITTDLVDRSLIKERWNALRDFPHGVMRLFSTASGVVYLKQDNMYRSQKIHVGKMVEIPSSVHLRFV